MPGQKSRISIKHNRSIPIPAHIFRDRSLSVLEVLVEYLKERKGLTYHEIAVMLNRDDRTIWTCFKRAKEKRGKEAKKK